MVTVNSILGDIMTRNVGLGPEGGKEDDAQSGLCL